jgi:signal transduction histidine kinase/ActR/RegA family two-component response regulator
MSKRARQKSAGSSPHKNDVEQPVEPAVPLHRLPYPTALLGKGGTVIHATTGFPSPPGHPSSPVGLSFLDWFEGESEGLVRAFIGERRVCEEARKKTFLRSEDSAAGVDFCDVHSPFSPGYAFRLVPLVDAGDGLCSLVLLLPAKILDLSAPSVAQREMRHRQRLAAVLEVSRAISSSLDRNVILQQIVDRVREVVSVPEVVLFLVEEDDKTLVPVVAKVDEFYDEVMAVRIRMGEGITGFVAETGRAEIVNQAEKDPRSIQVPGTPLEASSLLCVPLIIKDEIVGVTALTRFGEEGFDPDDLEVVTIFAAHCSVAIENAQLYEEIQDTVKELRATQNQLIQSAKLNALGEMAGGVAHDFNNVLTAILGRTQLLLRRSDNADAREALKVIERTALDGAHTVRRIQEFTRLRQDQGIERVEIDRVLRDVIELIRPNWEYPSRLQGIRIIPEIDLDSNRAIRGRAADLREVFTNLILNALDAMPEGGELRISSKDENDSVVVRIADTGVGMDESAKTRAFEPFFTTKADKGTGLGLSVAYGIVTRHGGKIEVETEPGKGTTFLIRIPVAHELMATVESKKEERKAAAMRILCVDDEQPVLEVLAEMLEALGHRAEQALGGEVGVEAIARFHPEVVFTDLGMPGTSGWDVAARVKEDNPDTIVVMVTGWGVQIEIDAARNRGVDYILPKPYTLDEVMQLLAGIAERKREAA